MSIRWKISLLLGLLALVMVFQSVDRVLHLKGSARSFEALALRVEQTLTNIETLSDATSQLNILIEQIALTMEPRDLSRQEARLSDILRELREVAQSLDGSSATLFMVGGHFDTVSAAAEHYVAQRAEVLRLRDMHDGIRDSLRADMQTLRAYVLPFRVRVLSKVSGVGTEYVAEDLRLLLTLSSLLGRIEDLLETLSADQTPTIKADVSRLVSSGVMALATAAPFPERKDIATTLARVHRRLSSDQGFSSTGLSLSDALIEEAAAASVLRAGVYDTGKEISSIVAESEREIGLVYARAAAMAEQRVWSEIVLNAGLGLGIVAAVWIVFAHQISSRLERLTSAVLRLASGDLAPVEKPVGRDELSHMMLSLEVFRQNARELRRSNDDLANFAYAASHDLRTPLRAIRDLVDWTLEDRAETLHPEVLRNLCLIRTRADRLSRLLHDLLDYARAGRETGKAEPVDVSAMLRDVGDLVGDVEDVTLVFEGEPIVETTATPLRTILLNLLSNAVKHKDRAHVTVTVSVTRAQEGWEIRIADDGPGIPKRYQEQVFELFKTLKSRDEVEGSGLGLAMVDKLVQQLDGTIRLVSNPEKSRGTTFILHIPARDTTTVQQAGIEGVAA